jgi:thymidylate kinase
VNPIKSPVTVIFFGADATGKSTQVRLLISYLKRKGFKVKRVWIRAHHSFVFVILKFMFKADLDNDPFLKEAAVGPAIRQSRFWLTLELTGVLPWVILRFYLPRLLGYAVVCDRYLPDTLVSLAYMYNDESLIYKFPSRILFKFIPKDVLLLHLTGEPSCIRNRSKEGKIIKNSIEFQRKNYRNIAYSLEAKTIDTSILDVNHTFTEVINLLENEFSPLSRLAVQKNSVIA